MILNTLSITGFRNYDTDQVSFDPGTNVIIGRNGQGKTNLLEAIYYLTGARSFRTRFDRELVGHERDSAKVRAEIFSEDREQTIEIALQRGRKKTILLNGVKETRSADIAGKIMAVLFSPDDLELVRGGAAGRRRFLDLGLSQLRPKYALWLAEFQKLYDHKTRILKDHREKPALLDTLDDFNLRLAHVGAQLIHYRAAFVEKLAPKAGAIHADFSGNQETLRLKYETVSSIENPLEKPAALLEQLLTHQTRLRQAELDAGLVLSGAHKDDIAITIDNTAARAFASQGQTRTAALSMKLGEREIFYEDRGEYPLLLLDDVLSELDAARQDYVLNRILDGQVFITCCEDNDIAKRTGGKIFTVESGKCIVD
ncbi:MAG: DNA replication/repair protein RecF [Oscillospiraceae bacterium]|nr:DNA replication/repair protein RecF [Oscillospiraceae bacterium]